MSSLDCWLKHIIQRQKTRCCACQLQYYRLTRRSSTASWTSADENKERCSHRCSSPVPDDPHQKKWASMTKFQVSSHCSHLSNTSRHLLFSHAVQIVLEHRNMNISKTVWQTTCQNQPWNHVNFRENLSSTPTPLDLTFLAFFQFMKTWVTFKMFAFLSVLSGFKI